MDNSINLTEKKITSRNVYNGALLNAFRDEVELPDGNTSVREWIKHPGASAVLPVFSNGDVMLIRQFRYPLHKEFLEVPAGKIDAGEPHQTTAVRELEEETGLISKNIQLIGHFYPSIGYTDEVIYLYVAWDLEQKTEDSDADEFMIPTRIPFSKALSMVEKGDITDGKTMACLFKAFFWWKRNAPFSIDLGH